MALAVALLVLLLATPAAYAEQYTVGDGTGWTTTGDYTTWVEGKTFTVGDTLCKLLTKAKFVSFSKQYNLIGLTKNMILL